MPLSRTSRARAQSPVKSLAVLARADHVGGDVEAEFRADDLRCVDPALRRRCR